MVIGVAKLKMHLFANITLSHDRWVTWFDGFGQVNLSHNLLKLVAIVLAKVEISLLKKMSWPHDEWVTWLGGWDTLNLNYKGYSKSNRTQRKKNICITNWGKLVLQIGAALFYYKLGQMLLQIEIASLLKIGASVVTNWGS